MKQIIALQLCVYINEPKPGKTELFRHHYTGFIKYKIQSSLYWLYYAEACNEWRGLSPRVSAWATQLRSSGGEPLATVHPI